MLDCDVLDFIALIYNKKNQKILQKDWRQCSKIRDMNKTFATGTKLQRWSKGHPKLSETLLVVLFVSNSGLQHLTTKRTFLSGLLLQKQANKQQTLVTLVESRSNGAHS